MIQAAATGAVDFREADPDDRWWWARLVVVLEYLERQCEARVLEAKHRHDVRLLDNYLSPADFQIYWDRSDTTIKLINNQLRPWLQETIQTTKTIMKRLETQWQRAFGNQDDPETTAEIDRLIAHWNSKARTPQ